MLYKKYLTNYLETVNAEHVMELRRVRRKQMVDVNIPEQEKKLKEIRAKLKSAIGSEREDLAAQLKKTEKYLNWLKGEVVFTDERSKLHEK